MSGLRGVWSSIGLVSRLASFQLVAAVCAFRYLVEHLESNCQLLSSGKNWRGKRLRTRRSACFGLLATMLVVASVGLNQRALAQDATEEFEPKNRVALPERVSVVAPDSNVPSEFAAFSGAWAGDGWNGVTPTVLVVEKIDQEGSAQVVFSWGDVAATKRPRGWLRVGATIKQGRLGFSVADHGTVEFNVTPDRRLFGRYTFVASGRRDYVLLTRMASADRADLIPASQRMLSGEIVTFPVASGSDPRQTAKLHGVLYRSPNAGRGPLVIFSGDSTASEIARTRPNRAPIRSRQMLSLGYSVLVLQRKGMGGSDGPLMEPRDELIPQQAQLQSALADLDAAVTFMKQQEYVDPSRVVVMGINRGGLLSVAYAGLHDGAVAGVVNTLGHWKVSRKWWQQMLTWGDFTAAQLAAAGNKTKVPMLWVYGAAEPAAREYARANYKAFTYQGGRATFVDVSDDRKQDLPNEPVAEKIDRAIAEYIQGLR